MSPEEIERALTRIERELREFRQEARRAAAIPAVMVTVAEAAQSLSRSRSTVWELIRCGELQTKTIGKTRMVPVSELHRLASLPTSRPSKMVRSSVAVEQEKVRAALRKKKR